MDHRSTKERRSLVAEMLRSAGAVTITDLQTRFAVRTESAGEARLAEAAFALLSPGETVFLDASSTTFFVARLIAERGLAVRVITNSLPVLRELSDSKHASIDVLAVAGTLQRTTGSFVGPSAVCAVRNHIADRLVTSVTAVTRHGVLADTDALEAEIRRAMFEHAEETVLLLDASRLSDHGGHAIAPVSAVARVLADGLGSMDTARLAHLAADMH